MLKGRLAAGLSVERPASFGRWTGLALIFLAAAVACVPVVRHMPTCGDDLQFHVLSWFDAQQSWRQGVAYPQWAMSANFGAGEPRFVFYPPLTWMLGAALGLVLPWTWVPVAMVFVLLAGTGVATCVLARRLLPEPAAAMAGVAAVLSLYPLFTAYDRAAFGELAGGMFVPLVLLFAMEGAVMPLALAVAGCWLSDAPVGVMAMYLLTLVAIVRSLQVRSWLPVLRAATGGVFGLGLVGFYLLPAAYEQRWVHIREAAGEGDPGLSVRNNFLFGHSASEGMATHDAGLHFVSGLVVAMVVVSLVCAGVVWWRRRYRGRMWVVLMCLPVAVLMLQLPTSLPVWEVMPKLQFLQFPWRWLVVLEAPLAVLLAGAFWPRVEVRLWKRWAMGVGFGGVVLSSLLYVSATGFMTSCNKEEVLPGLTAELAKGAGSWGADEYATLGSEDLMVASGLPDVCLVERPDLVLGQGAGPDQNPYWDVAQGSCVATARASVRSPERLRVGFVSPRAGWVVLKLRRYPAWRVRVNGVDAGGMPERADGLIVVPVLAGRVEVAVDWGTTQDVVVGRWLTVVCGLALGMLCSAHRRSVSSHLIAEEPKPLS